MKKPEVPDMAEVPISSMIDVVFLLIIFFVVTAAVDKEVSDEKIVLAEAPHGKPVNTVDPRSVVINVRDDGTLTMGMHTVTMEEISRTLLLLRQEYGTETDIPIVIRGDKDAPHEYIKRAFKAVTDTGLSNVRINAQRIDGN